MPVVKHNYIFPLLWMSVAASSFQHFQILIDFISYLFQSTTQTGSKSIRNVIQILEDF